MTQPNHKKPLTHCEKYGHSWSDAPYADGWKRCTYWHCSAALPPEHLRPKTPAIASSPSVPPPSAEQVSLF